MDIEGEKEDTVVDDKLLKCVQEQYEGAVETVVQCIRGTNS